MPRRLILISESTEVKFELTDMIFSTQAPAQLAEHRSCRRRRRRRRVRRHRLGRVRRSRSKQWAGQPAYEHSTPSLL